MKKHSKAILWLIFITLFLPQLYAQTEYQKMVSGLGHSQGETILDNGSLRFGGYTNKGQQEVIVRYTRKRQHPQNASLTSYGTVYYIYDLNGNLTFQWCYLNDFPHPAVGDVTDLESNDPADCAAILANIYFNDSMKTFSGRDYDLMAYQAGQDITLSNERIFGSIWIEQMQFGAEAAVHLSMAPEPTGDYFVGATAQQIFGRASDVAVARVDGNHQVIWNSRIDKEGHERFYQSSYIENTNELLVHGPKGYQPSRIYWLNATNGNFIRSYDYDLKFDGRRLTPYLTHVIQDQAGSLSDLNYVGYVLYRPSKDDSLQCKLAYFRAGQSGGLNAQQVYLLDGEQVFGMRIYEKNSNAFLIAGQIRDEATLESDGLLMEINRHGAVQWAKRIHHSTFEDTRDMHIDASGNIWALGRTNAYLTDPTERNFALFKFDGSGNFQNAFYYQKNRRDVCRSMLVNAAGEFILDGYQPSGWKRYYVKTDPQGTGPLCATVPFQPTVTNITFGTPDTEGFEETVDDVTVTHATFYEQDFSPTVEDATCPSCNCDQ